MADPKTINDIDQEILSIEQKRFGDVDFTSSFFDDLRDHYSNFDEWVLKKSNNGEQAYVYESGSEIKGFLYLKIEGPNEDYYDIAPAFAPSKRIKIGTFKTIGTGVRLGERFLRIAFDYAQKEKVSEIYLTLFRDDSDEITQLCRLIGAWGFEHRGTRTSTGEEVWIKSLTNYDWNHDSKYNYPLTSDAKKYYFLPILPEYHSKLFPDNILHTEKSEQITQGTAYQYAIEKTYLTYAVVKTYNIQNGDLVFIYRIGDKKPKKYHSVVSGTAVVQEISWPRTLDKCIEACENRSVFTKEEIKRICESGIPVVIKLLALDTFPNKVTLNDLYNFGIIEPPNGPRPLDKINKENATKIIELGNKNHE